jgi:hypothetical protein
MPQVVHGSGKVGMPGVSAQAVAVFDVHQLDHPNPFPAAPAFAQESMAERGVVRLSGNGPGAISQTGFSKWHIGTSGHNLREKLVNV